MDLPTLVRLTLEEDIGIGDITTHATVDPTLVGTAYILAKEPLVVAGSRAAVEVFRQLGVAWTTVCPDGSAVADRTVIATLSGPLGGILSGERAALNFLMRLSGIATHTRRAVEAANGLSVVDTRKTTPLHRALEKEAVRLGGARNHRFGLFDGILIKDNHLVAAGGITNAVRRARALAHPLLKVEVEVENLGELQEALDAGADVVLLDNMDDATLREAVRIAAGRVLLEASGNMTAERLSRLGDVGLSYVSMGGLIHQARWADLSLRINPVV